MTGQRPTHSFRPLYLVFVIAAVVSGALVLAAAPIAGASVSEAEVGTSTSFSAVELERSIRNLADQTDGGEDLWPGFDILSVPLAVYDGESTYLFRHPSPPDKFETRSDDDLDALVQPGRHEAVFADSIAEIGGEVTATFLLKDRPEPNLREAAAVVTHEAFHVHQHHAHPDWVVNVVAQFTYPIDEVEVLQSRYFEIKALQNAAAASELDEAACWVRTAIEQREQRHARIGELHADYEQMLALLEGTAFHVERLAAGTDPAALAEPMFPAAEIRRHAAETGAVMAGFLNLFAPGWKLSLSADDQQELERLLKEAVGEGDRCTFDDGTQASVAQFTKAGIEGLIAQRKDQLDKFEARSGWRVEIRGGNGGLLFARQIDPVNIEPLGDQRLLHTRSVRLGNDHGKMEVTQEAVLTEGAGEDPLSEGVRYVMLTGLEKPKVHEQDNRVELEAGGLKLDFTSAKVKQDDHRITIDLQP